MIHHLCNCFDILVKAGKLPQLGYSKSKVFYVFKLDSDGTIIEVEDLTKEKVSMDVPIQTTRSSGVLPYFLCDNGKYFLGIGSKQSWNFSAELHTSLLKDIDSDIARAICKYFSRPPQTESPKVAKIVADANTTRGSRLIVFNVNGVFAQDVPGIKKVWLNRFFAPSPNDVIGFCSVTGEKAPLVKANPKIKGMRGGATTGASLAPSNLESGKSYGDIPVSISKFASAKYSGALNFLVSSENNRLVFGDLTLIFWADSADDVYSSYFIKFLCPQFDKSDDDLINAFPDIGLDLNTNFHVIGLCPVSSGSRIATYLNVHNKFGFILGNIKNHLKNLSIIHSEREPNYIALWTILKSTAPYLKDYPYPEFTGAVIQSILLGIPYPHAFYTAALANAKRKPDYYTTAVVKACLEQQSPLRRIGIEKV